jgi:thiol-disulfide isomerase/thioredoxin
MELCLSGKLLPFIAGALLLPLAVAQNLVRDVRSDIGKNDFTAAEARIGKYRASSGVTSEMLEALSWLGRGALAAKQLDRAEAYAAETHKLALEMLKSRRLDADGNLPIALGAAIEVEAQVAAARGERSAAIDFLGRELRAYQDTSIRTRIQKNIHLLSLEGKPAPDLEIREWLGPKPTGVAGLKGRVVLLFFWAHWCGDCKAQAPILARLNREYGPRGLVLAGPTTRYGYTARGQDATPAEELKYIAEIRARHYADLAEMPVPVSEENFRNYGVSTTPTLVLIARGGLVRLYHPGQMSYEELASMIEAALKK